MHALGVIAVAYVAKNLIMQKVAEEHAKVYTSAENVVLARKKSQST